MPAAPAAGFPSSSALVPPLLVGEHFATALVFFVCGALGLVVAAGDIAGGHFYVPRVAGVVHLFTLGWIMLSIFGALCQFLPVAVGKSIWSFKLAHVSFALQALGVAALVGGLFTNSRFALFAGAASLTLAFWSFGVNLTLTLLGSKQREFTYFALAAATVSLFATPVYGVLLAVYMHHGGLLDPFAVIAHHAHVAVMGVVLLVMVGVAHRLMPMFLLTHGISERPAWAALALLFSASLLVIVHDVAQIFAGELLGGAALTVAGALGCAGVLAMAAQAALFYRGRKKRLIDAGMSLAAAALLTLLAAAAMAPFALSRGVGEPHLLVTYFVLLLGAITLFVAAHYYKIVPFLVWNHRYGPFLGKRKVPKVADLYSMPLAYLNAAVFVVALITVALGAYFGSRAAVTTGGLAFALGATLEAAVMARIARRKVT